MYLFCIYYVLRINPVICINYWIDVPTHKIFKFLKYTFLYFQVSSTNFCHNELISDSKSINIKYGKIIQSHLHIYYKGQITQEVVSGNDVILWTKEASYDLKAILQWGNYNIYHHI